MLNTSTAAGSSLRSLFLGRDTATGFKMSAALTDSGKDSSAAASGVFGFSFGDTATGGDGDAPMEGGDPADDDAVGDDEGSSMAIADSVFGSPFVISATERPDVKPFMRTESLDEVRAKWLASKKEDKRIASRMHHQAVRKQRRATAVAKLTRLGQR